MSLQPAGDVVGKVLEKIEGRGFATRWARRMQKHSRQNWRRNGLRPRGRGYDWARTLIAEKLLELVTLGQLEDGGGDADDNGSGSDIQQRQAAASGQVELKMAELAAAVGCHVRIAQREVARLESMGCLARDKTGRGRGRGTVLHIYHKPLAARVLGRLHRFEQAKTGTSPQLSLPLTREVQIPPDIQASIDRMAKIALVRRGETVDNSVEKNLAGKGDPSSSHTLLQPSRNTPSALAVASGEGGLRRREIKFAKIVQRPDLKSLELDWRECEFTDKASREMLSEPLRRRLSRHLRLCCWYRGLGLVETRRVMGAVGWTAASIGKASKRKYLLHDAIGWIMASKTDELRTATASWTRTLGRVQSGFGKISLMVRRVHG